MVGHFEGEAQSESAQCSYCGALLGGSVCTGCEGLAVVCGDYKVGRALGRGGNGVVYEAARISTGAVAAIKVMSLRGASDWKSVELFERGTTTLLHLKHESVPACYGFDRDAHGRLYQVRERLDGGTLKQRIEDHHGCPPEGLRTFLTALLQTLQYLHGLAPPIVHRDIKPANIMFRDASSWKPVLVDFEALSFGASQTGTTIVVSPGYTAPEQLAGHAVPASDLYSVGAVMLYMLTGAEPSRLPVKDGRHDLRSLTAHYDETIVRVISRLLAPSLTDRYASASQALRDLYSPPVLARRPTTGAQLEPDASGGWRFSLNVPWIALAGLALLGVVMGSFLLAGAAVDRRIEAFTHELRQRPMYGMPSDQAMVAQSIAFKHDLLLEHLEIRSRMLRGQTPVDIVDELKAIDAYDPGGLHRVVDDTLRGDVYTRVTAVAIARFWPWTRERAIGITLIATN